MQKGHLFPFSAAHAAHHAGAPLAVHQAPVMSSFSAAHAAQEASASQAAPQASHSSLFSLAFPLPMHVPTQRHVERWTASSFSHYCRRPIKRKKKEKIKESTYRDNQRVLYDRFIHSFIHSIRGDYLEQEDDGDSSQKHRTIMGSIFISSMFLFSPLMCN